MQSERVSDSTALPHPSCPIGKVVTGHWPPCTSVCSLWIVAKEFTRNKAWLEVTYRIVDFLN